MQKNKIPSKELEEFYKDFYIVLQPNLIGNKFDIIKCVSTREGHTTIIKSNGDNHWFAASIKYALEKEWLIPFSHISYTKLHVQAALEEVCEKVDFDDHGTVNTERQWEPNLVFNKRSILNAYLLENIK